MPKLFVGNRVLDCGVVIFDKDGTLVDYRAVDLELAKARKSSVESLLGKDVADLWERAVGANVRSEIDYCGPLGTLPLRDEIIVAATAIYLKGYSWDESKQLAQKAYADADESMKPPYGAVLLECVAETLQKLKEHGLKLAVASTDAHSRTVGALKFLKIDSLFDAFVGPEDVANGKPAPDMIFEVLRLTGCRTNDAVMVGDSISDMAMGKNAKVKASIGVLTGITSRADLEKVADIVIDSVAQMRIS